MNNTNSYTGTRQLKRALALPGFSMLREGPSAVLLASCQAPLRTRAAEASCSEPLHKLLPLPPVLFPSLSSQQLLFCGLFRDQPSLSVTQVAGFCLKACSLAGASGPQLCGSPLGL